MTQVRKFGGWFPGVTCAVEATFFAYLAYLSLAFDTTFYGHWISRRDDRTVLFALVSVLFLFAAAAIFQSRPGATYLCAVLFSVTVSWVVLDVFSSEPPAWPELVWIMLPTIALCGLLYAWINHDSWEMSATQ
jgi:hypothetical protein